MKVTYSVGRYGRTYYCCECKKMIPMEEWKSEHGTRWLLHHPVNKCSHSDEFFEEPEFYTELMPISQPAKAFKAQSKESFSSKHEILWFFMMLGAVICIAILASVILSSL